MVAWRHHKDFTSPWLLMQDSGYTPGSIIQCVCGIMSIFSFLTLFAWAVVGSV